MDLLLLLRLMTGGAALALVAALVALLIVGRGGTLSTPRRSAWMLITVVHGFFAVSGWAVELQYFFLVDDPRVLALAQKLYHGLFLLNGALDGLLPLSLLFLFLGATPYRHLPLLGAAGVVLTAVVGLGTGSLGSWGRMLDVSQILTFQAIAAYLVFLGLYLLKRLPEVDLYLAAFLAVNAIFQLLLPVQEAFFLLVGESAVTDIWHLHLLVQLTAIGVQIAIALSALNAMRYRPLVSVFRTAGN